jgi:hypothetical protein
LSIPAPTGIGLVRSHDISLMATNYQVVLRHEEVDRRSQEILDRHDAADFGQHLAYSHRE